jgi:hypothetical protein
MARFLGQAPPRGTLLRQRVKDAEESERRSVMERMVFEAHSEDQRDKATNFQELPAGRTIRFQQAQRREVEAIGARSDRIAVELEKESLVDALVLQTIQKRELIKNSNTDLAKLVVKGSETQASRHAQLNLFAQDLTAKIQSFQSQRRSFVTLQDEVSNMRSAKSLEILRQVASSAPPLCGHFLPATPSRWIGVLTHAHKETKPS